MLDIFTSNPEWMKATTPEELEAIKAKSREAKEKQEEENKQRKARLALSEEMFAKLIRDTFGKNKSVKVATWEFCIFNQFWLPSFIMWHPDRVDEIIETLFEAGYKAGTKYERNRQKKKATTQTTK